MSMYISYLYPYFITFIFQLIISLVSCRSLNNGNKYYARSNKNKINKDHVAIKFCCFLGQSYSQFVCMVIKHCYNLAPIHLVMIHNSKREHCTCHLQESIDS